MNAVLDTKDQDLILGAIRTVPDFPKKGINFYDIATLLAHPEAWAKAISSMQRNLERYEINTIYGIESRGFLVGAALAMRMNLPFGMIRKKGKLPGKVLGHTYDLEYGSDTIEIQPDLVPENAKVAIVDDLLATGGTMAAAEKLLADAGAEILCGAAIIELDGLNGRSKLGKPFESLLVCPA